MKKPCAWNLTRKEIHYRHSSFSAGLKAAGYEVRTDTPQGKPGDVLLIWNRYYTYHDLAVEFEKAGGTVLVAENGYLGPSGVSPHSMNPRMWFAIGLGAHNDSTAVPEGGPERWAALGVDLKRWRGSGEHVLVCPNRSFGRPGRIMPSDWGNDTVKRLAKLTKREIRLRPHPGNDQPKKPLADDLAGAWAVAIWCSSAGVHSLVRGIPVFVDSPFWIMKGCNAGVDIEHPKMPDRLPHFQRLAWGQWHLKEIEDGTAFDHCLRATRQTEISASH